MFHSKCLQKYNYYFEYTNFCQKIYKFVNKYLSLL
jgi:hypothetical protein